MKQLILAGLAGSVFLGCAEPATLAAPVPGPQAYHDEYSQSPPPGVPEAYNVPTALSVAAGGGFIEIASGNRAYGESVVSYRGTHGRARATLEISGYPDATGESLNSTLLPLSNDVDAYAFRNIAEVCNKSARTEAFGEAWNEFVGISVLVWGKTARTSEYTAMLPACPTRPSGETVDRCDWYQLEVSVDGGETWEENGDVQWLCPGDEPEWATRNGRTLDLGGAGGVAAKRGVPETASRKRRAAILFVGTHYLEVKAHALVQSGTGFGVDAVVIVDTMRASNDDVEAAILAAAYHVNTAPLPASQRIAVARSGTRLTGPAKARAADRAEPILKATKSSRAVTTVSGWRGRAFKTTVELPVVASARGRR